MTLPKKKVQQYNRLQTLVLFDLFENPFQKTNYYKRKKGHLLQPLEFVLQCSCCKSNKCLRFKV